MAPMRCAQIASQTIGGIERVVEIPRPTKDEEAG